MKIPRSAFGGDSGGLVLSGTVRPPAAERASTRPRILALSLLTLCVLVSKYVTIAAAFHSLVSRTRLVSAQRSGLMRDFVVGVEPYWRRRTVTVAFIPTSRITSASSRYLATSCVSGLFASTDNVASPSLASVRNICLLDNSQDELARRLAVLANKASNDVLETLIIAYDPLTDTFVKHFKGVFDALDAASNDFVQSEGAHSPTVQHAAHVLSEAKAYARRLEAILLGRQSMGNAEENFGGVYSMGYQRILNCLGQLGCSMPSLALPQQNYCLSLLDTMAADQLEEAPSITQMLNLASNSVVRAMKYCGYSRRLALAAALETRLGHSPGHGGSHPGSTVGMSYGARAPQPCIYARALIHFLKHGKAETLRAVSYDGPKSSATIGHSNITNFVPESFTNSSARFVQPPSLRLLEPFRACLLRVIESSERPQGQRFDRPVDPECPL